MPEGKNLIYCQCGESFPYGEDDIYVKDDEQGTGIGHVRCPECNAEHDVGIEDEDDIEQTHTL